MNRFYFGLSKIGFATLGTDPSRNGVEAPPAPGGATSAVFPPAGGAGSVRVATAAGCGWTAASDAPWVTLLSGASGTGSGRVSYAVAANDEIGRAHV